MRCHVTARNNDASSLPLDASWPSKTASRTHLDDGLTMDAARGPRRTRHAASAASSQEVQAQAQAQLELEAATQRRRNRRQALQVQVTPDAALAVAAAAEAGAGAQQTPEVGHRRREMAPPPNPFRLHRCECLRDLDAGCFWVLPTSMGWRMCGVVLKKKKTTTSDMHARVMEQLVTLQSLLFQ